MSDDELMAEVSSIINGASEAIQKDQGEEMKQVLASIAKAASEGDLVPKGQEVMMFLLIQRDIHSIDPDTANRTALTMGKTIQELEAEGASGASVSEPYTFDSCDEAVEHLGNPLSSLLATDMAGDRGWASIVSYVEQGTTTYIMVASRCVTIRKVLPTGDTMTSYFNPDSSESSEVEAQLYANGKRIVEAQYRFTATAQVLKASYPSAYEALVKRARRKMEDDNGSDEQ